MFDGDQSAAEKEQDCEVSEKAEREPAPLQGKGHFLVGILNGLEDKGEYSTIDRLFKEQDVELAVQWFKKQIKREAVRIDGKGHHVRLENVMEVVERAFGDCYLKYR